MSAPSAAPRRWPLVLVILLALGGLGIGLMDWGGEEQSPPLEVGETRPLPVASHGYVSSISCRECHAEQHRSWHASYHRMMTQPVTAETAPAFLDGSSVSVEGETYEFSRSGEEYWVERPDPADPQSGSRVKERVVLLTGSHHMHVFWVESSFPRTPGQLPIVYLIQEQRWIPRRSAFLRPPDLPKGHELGRWNQTCSGCHSTHPQPRLNPETRVWDTHVAEFGIACEACHGPGQTHVEKHRQPGTQAIQDDLIVNPAKLSKEASGAVCGQCHSIQYHDFSQIPADTVMQDGFDFRPGQPLEEFKVRRVVQASESARQGELFRTWQADGGDPVSLFWADGMARVTGREYNGLIESPCYQRGELTCLSCHTMHPEPGTDLAAWRDDQLKPHGRDNRACLQCHQELVANVPAHTYHGEGSSGSQCMNCHMPHTTYGLLKTVRSHQIDSPSMTVSLKTGRLNACNLCHLNQTNAWTAEHLHQWYGQPLPELSPEDRELSAAAAQLLRGDAAQRAMLLAAFGHPGSQTVSGTDWMPPLLLFGLHDTYEANQQIALRSLRTLPRWEKFEFDPFTPREQRGQQLTAELERLERELRLPPDTKTLFTAEGVFDFTRAMQLIQQRDHRPVLLQE